MTDAKAYRALQRAKAALAARALVEQLPRELGDRLPVRLTPMSRPLWARLTKKRHDPFRVSAAQINAWADDVVARHPPLGFTVERPAPQAGRRAKDDDVAAVA